MKTDLYLLLPTSHTEPRNLVYSEGTWQNDLQGQSSATVTHDEIRIRQHTQLDDLQGHSLDTVTQEEKKRKKKEKGLLTR